MNEQNINFETDGINLSYMNIMLEITRRCNLKCEHCMRGDAQNLDMSGDIMKKLFSQVDAVFQISLTGGEPFIAPDVIEELVDTIIKNKVKVWQCTTVENGTILDERGIRCVKALNRLGEYIKNEVWVITDEERLKDVKLPISISISNSNFHANDVEKAIEFYKQYASDCVEVLDQGEWETEIVGKDGEKYKIKDTKNSKRWIKKEGRAVTNIQGSNSVTDTYCVKFFHQDGKSGVETGIQICANGNVVIMEPMSFDTMDNKNMGNILEEPLSCMIHKWNWNEPLSKEEVNLYCKNLDVINNPKVPSDKKVARKVQNDYLDMKKTLYVEGHKDYPCLDKKDLSIAVTCVLAWRILDIIREVGTLGQNLSDEEIIKTILETEIEGEVTENWNRQNLIDIVEGLIEKNKAAMIKEYGLLYYLTHKTILAIKEYGDMYEVKNVYDK